MSDVPALLVVDDEPALRESLQFMLQQQGYLVRTAASGPEALQLTAEHPPDLILLDVMLPGFDGFEVTRRLRALAYGGPILLLTARDEEIDQVLGFEGGADDYVTKPFRHRELLARIRAHLRRVQREPLTPEADGAALQIFAERHEVHLKGRKLDLTPREYDLLAFFFLNRGKALPRERILEQVWGYDFEGESRVVNVTIQRLREKIEIDPAQPRLLTTVRGVGYLLDA